MVSPPTPPVEQSVELIQITHEVIDLIKANMQDALDFFSTKIPAAFFTDADKEHPAFREVMNYSGKLECEYPYCKVYVPGRDIDVTQALSDGFTMVTLHLDAGICTNDLDSVSDKLYLYEKALWYAIGGPTAYGFYGNQPDRPDGSLLDCVDWRTYRAEWDNASGTKGRFVSEIEARVDFQVRFNAVSAPL